MLQADIGAGNWNRRSRSASNGIGEVEHNVADLVGSEVILQVDNLLHSGERHDTGALRAGFQGGVEGDLIERGGAGLAAGPLARPPAVENVGQAEQAAHHTRLRVLGGASEEIIVIEIEVDDLA